MKISARNLCRILIFLVVALYSFIVFILTNEFTSNFWVNYIFVLLAPIATFIFTFKKDTAIASFPYNISYLKYILIYAIIELVLGTILMYTVMKLKFVFLIQIPILLILLILIVYFTMKVKPIRANLNIQKEKVDYLSRVKIKLEVVKGLTNDREVQRQLDKLISDVHYSDYNSVPEVQSIEQEMLVVIDEMKNASSETQMVLIKKLNGLLKERNQTSLLMKR